VLAFDIETTKDLLKFPDREIDRIMVILCMATSSPTEASLARTLMISSNTPIFNELNEVNYSYVLRLTPYSDLPGSDSFLISEKQRVVATFSRDVIDMYQETRFAKDPEDEQRCGTYGLFPLGQARFLLTARKSGFESGYDSKVGI